MPDSPEAKSPNPFAIRNAVRDVMDAKSRAMRIAADAQSTDRANARTPNISARRNTPSASDAIRGERVGEEGERAFGPPLDTTPTVSQKTEEEIRNEIRESLRQRQSTDVPNASGFL